KFFELLLLALGGQQNDEIKNRKDQQDRDELDERIDARPWWRAHREHEVIHTITHDYCGSSFERGVRPVHARQPRIGTGRLGGKDPAGFLPELLPGAATY